MTLFDPQAPPRRPSDGEPSEAEFEEPRRAVRGLLADDPVLNGFGIAHERVLVTARDMPVPADGAFLVLGWDCPRFWGAALQQTLTVSAHAGRRGLVHEPIADTPSVVLDRVMTVLTGAPIDIPTLFVRMTSRRLFFEELDMLPAMVEIAVFEVRSARGGTGCPDYPRSAADI
jgi:hypothetical protein